MQRSRMRVAPLAVITGGAVLAACVCTVGVAAVVMRANHQTTAPVWQVVLAGGPMAFVLAGAAAWIAARFARSLRLLRAEAVRRLHDPSAPVGAGTAARIPDWSGAELAALAQTLDAIHLRVRMADDVAERHRRAAETASAGMFELLSGLVAAEEGARGQLSAELHDTVAQSLMAARSRLGDPSMSFDEEVADLVAEAEEQVRAVMARTRPPALRDGDLARAVGGLRDDLSNRYGLNVRVDDEWVVAVVRDEGPGFDPDDVRPDGGRHVGLGLLRDRARLVGGSLDITSWPENGTTLTLRLPRGAGAAAGLLPVQRAAVAPSVA